MAAAGYEACDTCKDHKQVVAEMEKFCWGCLALRCLRAKQIMTESGADPEVVDTFHRAQQEAMGVADVLAAQVH